MIDLKPALLTALSALPACTREAFVAEDLPLPLVVISDADRRVTARADGEDYLEEYTAAADVYAKTRADGESLCRGTDASLSALGLRRVSFSEEFDETPYAFHFRMLFRVIVQGETLYQ